MSQPDDRRSNLTGGPEGEAEPTEDRDLVGPDGTKYDEEAAEEAHRKTTGSGEADKDAQDN